MNWDRGARLLVIEVQLNAKDHEYRRIKILLTWKPCLDPFSVALTERVCVRTIRLPSLQIKSFCSICFEVYSDG